tara:strand:+ start:726 stop:1385 length:660 start_codon:yes stop_codon:yes gene_type:complete
MSIKLSYGITTHNEAEELNRLLEILVHKTDVEDEIVIVDDFSNQETQDVIGSWVQQYSDKKTIRVFQRKLDKDFASQKNFVIEQCTGDYIFHLDADEYPHEVLLLQLKQILEINDVDLVWIPRVNTVDGFTDEDVQKWGWRINEKNWVNYPDYQARVFRNNKDIRWTRPLHEYITGCKTYSHLPPHEELSLYHPKTIQKQVQQNLFYNENFSQEMNVRK